MKQSVNAVNCAKPLRTGELLQADEILKETRTNQNDIYSCNHLIFDINIEQLRQNKLHKRENLEKKDIP